MSRPAYNTYETAASKYLAVGSLKPQFYSQLIDLITRLPGNG